MTERPSFSLQPVHMLAFAALVGPVLVCIVNRVMAPLFILTAVVVLGLMVWRDRRLPNLRGGLPLPWLAGFVVYGAVTALWAVDPWLALVKALKLGSYIFGLQVLLASVQAMTEEQKALLKTVFVIGVGAGLAFLLFEQQSTALVNRLFRGITADTQKIQSMARNLRAITNPGAAALSVMIWPVVALLWLKGKRAMAGVALVLAVGIISRSDSSAAVLAALGGGGVMLLGAVIGAKRISQLLAACFLLGALVMPLAASQFDWRELQLISSEDWLSKLPNSAYHRVMIYGFAAERILKKPFLGWGLNSSRVMPGGRTQGQVYRKVDDPADPEFGTRDRRLIYSADLLPLHPHSLFLQLWLELGAAGVILAVLTMWALLNAVARAIPGRVAGSAALAQVGAFVIIGALAFGAWQDWWLSTMVLMGAFGAATLGGRAEEA